MTTAVDLFGYVRPEPVEPMDQREMVTLLAQLPKRKVSTPDEVRARREERKKRKCGNEARMEAVAAL